jgi:hypothetical protein
MTASLKTLRFLGLLSFEQAHPKANTMPARVRRQMKTLDQVLQELSIIQSTYWESDVRRAMICACVGKSLKEFANK